MYLCLFELLEAASTIHRCFSIFARKAQRINKELPRKCVYLAILMFRENILALNLNTINEIFKFTDLYYLFH